MSIGSAVEKRYAWVEINLKNLDHNIRFLKSLGSSAGGAGIIAIVKANAYGHGAVQISKQAMKSGASALGVALVKEGVELRKAGINAPIYVLGECSPYAVSDAINNRLTLTINSVNSAETFSRLIKKEENDLSVNINIDTGMNRVGINWRDAVDSFSRIRNIDKLNIVGIFSHFSCASIKEEDYSMKQWERFSKIREKLETLFPDDKYTYHFANSSAFFRFPFSHLDLARLGLSIYGLNPYADGWEHWIDKDIKKMISSLKSVLSLKSRISFIKRTGKDEPISYCGTFKTSSESIIATVPVGYADGYNRLLSNKASVLIAGMEAPVLGNITMDQFMVDITEISKKDIDVSCGDEVTLIGKSGDREILVEDIAGFLKTINYEVLCMISSRIPRIYKQ